MRWIRRTALLAATAAIVVLAPCAPFKPGPPAAAPLPFGSAHPQAQELYYIVNNERAANGLGPVGWHDQLGGLAQSWSDYMAVSGNYSHHDLDAVLQNPAYAGFSARGENILHGGCGITAAQMDQAWMSSPEHRANILGNFSGIGVAYNDGDLYATRSSGADSQSPRVPRPYLGSEPDDHGGTVAKSDPARADDLDARDRGRGRRHRRTRRVRWW